MKRMCITLALGLACGAAFLPSVAYAANVDQQNLAAGDALHAEGTALVNAGKYGEASKKFGEAFAKSQNPSSLFAQAVAERKQEHWERALKLFKTYLSLPSNVKVTAEWKKRAEGEVESCEKNVCRIDVRADSFSVDGASEIGVVYAEPGTHAVAMTGKGPEKLVSVKCIAGGVVTVAYDEGAKSAPIVPPPPPLEKGEAGSWLLPAVLAGVGVVGLGVGFGLGAAAKSKGESLDQLGPGVCADRGSASCVNEADRLSSGKTLNTVGIISVIGGSAAFAGAIIATLVVRPWEMRERKHATWIAPTMGTQGPGFVAGGSF